MLKRVLDDDSRPQGEESCEDKVRRRVQQHVCVGWITQNRQEEVEALKGILKLVFVAQKLLLEANRRLRGNK